MEALLAINHIFITHSHLDHVAFIPFLLDTVMGIRTDPVTVHATHETILALRQHIFNWTIWPDFNAIPDVSNPFLQYHEIKLAETLNLNGRKFTALPVNHVVPAVGYQIEGNQASMVYTGDTTTCDALWVEASKINNLKYIIIETAFSNSELALAKISKHLCPSMLEAELAKLNLSQLAEMPEVYITHLKPGEDEMIMHEIAASSIELPVSALQNNQIINL
jgi:ribonuclease BN (tRNA processing enzyme)